MVGPSRRLGRPAGRPPFTSATRLSFWARSDIPGLEVSVGYGLLLRDVAFFDSTRQAGVFVLTPAWKQYTFDLRGKNLGRIKSAFYFTMASPGPGGPHHLYFDDIRYE